MKKNLKLSLVFSCLLLILGGLLTFKSEETLATIAFVIGGVLISFGVLALIQFIRNYKKSIGNDLNIIYGIGTIISGILVIKFYKGITGVLPFIFGLIIFASSIIKIEYSSILKDQGIKTWKATGILSILSALCGLFLMIHPFVAAKLVIKTIGIIISVYSVLDIVSAFTISKSVTKEEKIKEAKIEEIRK